MTRYVHPSMLENPWLEFDKCRNVDRTEDDNLPLPNDDAAAADSSADDDEAEMVGNDDDGDDDDE